MSQLIKTIKFQYFSDLHLEFLKSSLDILRLNIVKTAPNLILGGDIGYPHQDIYKLFINLMSQTFDRVFVISGNHEYYNTDSETLDKIDEQIKTICSSFSNVHHLQNEIYSIPDTNIVVFGTTLWSQIKKEEENNITRRLSDYYCIEGFNVDMCNKLHHQSVQSLKEHLEKHPDKKFIVVSHHLPSYSLIHPKYRGSGLCSGFATEVEIKDHERIVGWVAGHTHTPMEIGKFHVNPIGYDKENKDSDFNKIFEIEE